MPSSIAQLRERFNATKDRYDVTLKQFLSGRGYEGDDVDRILSSIEENKKKNGVSVEASSVPIEAPGVGVAGGDSDVKIDYGIL